MPARLAAAALLAFACTAAPAMPTTFGPVIGNALLCRSHLDNVYFHRYLSTAFGPPYKHEGGAYWFKTEASLWGRPVSEVMVSDDTSELVFLAAVTDGKPEELEAAIRTGAGQRHLARDASSTPLRVSNPGSVIAYHKDKSKIYCARYKPLPAGH